MSSGSTTLRLARGRSSRHGATQQLPLLLLLVTLLCCCGTWTAHAAVYTTAISLLNTPAVSFDTTGSAVAGLNQACVNSANLTATADDRAALSIRTDDMSLYVASTVGTGTFYVAGFYDGNADAWFWSDGVSGTVTLFGRGPTCEAVNTVMASNWAPGYPKLGNSTGIGSLKYVVYDGTALGWKNVDGTLSYDGAICECKDKLAPTKKKFPWWAILIIVLGSVAIIAIAVVIVVCCCCKKKKNGDAYDDESGSSSSDEDGSPSSSRSVKVGSGRRAKGKMNRYTREDDDFSDLTSRASSYRSNATPRTGPAYVRSHSGRSFNSRATSVSGKSGQSSELGSCSSDSYSYSYSGSDSSSYTASTSSSGSSSNSDTSSSSSSAASSRGSRTSSRSGRSGSSSRSGRSGYSSRSGSSRSARR